MGDRLLGESLPPFVGRERELDRLAAEFTHVVNREARLVLIHGPAGIGKTALLRKFVRSLDESVQTLYLDCAQDEWAPTPAILSRLAGHPVHHRPSGTGDDLLGYLSDRLATGALVLVVDEAQWIDHTSAAALCFALRSLAHERILVLLAGRDDQGPAELRRLTFLRLALAGLPAGDLLRAFPAQLTEYSARRLREHTDGNPRYAQQVLVQASPDELSDPWSALPVPPGPAVEAVGSMLAATSAARMLAKAVSVFTVHTDDVSLDMLGGFCDVYDFRDDRSADLRDYERLLGALHEGADAGLLRVRMTARGAMVRFADPLMGRAVYRDLGPSEVARLHAAVAESVTDDAERMLHRLSALPVRGGVPVTEIAKAGMRAADDGAWATAASLLCRAAKVSPEYGVYAVEALVFDGRLKEARDLLRTIPRGHRPFARGMLAHFMGQMDDARTCLTDALAGCADPDLRARIGEHLELGCDTDPDKYLLLMRHGRTPPGQLLQAASRAMACHRRGEWAEATAAAQVAVAFADEIGPSWPAAHAHAVASLVPAARGEWARAEHHVTQSRRLARRASPFAGPACAAAHLAAVRNLHHEVIEALADVRAPGPVAWPDLLIEAHMAIGRAPAAHAVAAEWGAGPYGSALLSPAPREALESAHSEEPFEQAKIWLAYGSLLRRAGHRMAAAEVLRAAQRVFDDLGALPYGERCATELTACQRRRQFHGLTPRQYAVARLVARGMTNGQIARELVLSEKTVEYHISQAYRRLGICSRVTLAKFLDQAGRTPRSRQ
ncbi:AAA family ATPase [Streptosporangiaceae bacterium NEAU-GS5]|nr:AAA family ATPase [Streptosporangiaceae bacterium NEAU-GS5]